MPDTLAHDGTFDPTIREALEIILEKHNMNLDDKLTTLCIRQDVMRSLIGALSLALKDYQIRFLD